MIGPSKRSWKGIIMRSLLFFLTFVLFMSGCQSTATRENRTASNPAPATASPIAASSSKTHEHSAPHDGTLIEFGEEFAHIELVLDALTGELTAYALDGEAEKSVPLRQKSLDIDIETPTRLSISLEAVANQLTGEKIGSTSEFKGRNDQLKQLTEFEGTIRTIDIRGKRFAATKFKFPSGKEGH